MNLVLCEGKEDMLVMAALAAHLGIASDLIFESYDSADSLRSNLRNLRSQSRFASGGLRNVLVTRDADSSPDDTWTALSSAVREIFGIRCDRPGAWEATPEGPGIAAWLIPGIAQAGMIETLCMSSSRDIRPEVFGCLDSFVECLRNHRAAEVHPKEVFAYWTICAQDRDPRKRLSLERALSHLPFNWDHPVFEGLSGILRETATRAGA